MLIKRTKCFLTGLAIIVSFRAHLTVQDFPKMMGCVPLRSEMVKNVYFGCDDSM